MRLSLAGPDRSSSDGDLSIAFASGHGTYRLGFVALLGCYRLWTIVVSSEDALGFEASEWTYK